MLFFLLPAAPPSVAAAAAGAAGAEGASRWRFSLGAGAGR